MKPSQLAARLRNLASYIENTPRPSRTKVASTLKSVVSSLTVKTAASGDPEFYAAVKPGGIDPDDNDGFLGFAILPWSEAGALQYDDAPVHTVQEAAKLLAGKRVALTDMEMDLVETINSPEEYDLQIWIDKFER